MLDKAHFTGAPTIPMSTIQGIPKWLTVRDCQLAFEMDLQPMRKFINEHIRPIPGAVVKVGRKIYIMAWAVQRLFQQTGRCPECGTYWKDMERGVN